MPGDPNTSYTTAVELPPELIHSILDRLVAPYPLLAPVHSKRGLSACSLTCRHWTEVIRPFIFRTIVLKQPEDIVQLLEFLDAGVSVGPALSDCVEKLALEVNLATLVGAVPCLHHYYRLVKCLRAFKGAWLYISNDHNPTNGESRRQLIIRSLLNMLSSSLPKTLPGVLSLFNSLVLSSLGLRSIAHLVHTVNSLPGAQYCRYSSIAFEEDMATHRIPIRRSPSRLNEVEALRCGDGSLKSQVELCSMIADTRKRLGFSVDAWVSVHGIMLAITDCQHDFAVSMQLITGPTRAFP
jgi:hypothetical protein